MNGIILPFASAVPWHCSRSAEPLHQLSEAPTLSRHVTSHFTKVYSPLLGQLRDLFRAFTDPFHIDHGARTGMGWMLSRACLKGAWARLMGVISLGHRERIEVGSERLFLASLASEYVRVKTRECAFLSFIYNVIAYTDAKTRFLGLTHAARRISAAFRALGPSGDAIYGQNVDCGLVGLPGAQRAAKGRFSRGSVPPRPKMSR